MIEGDSLSLILDARGDSLAACESLPWLSGFRAVPDDAAAPLAMSGPHPRAVGTYGPEWIAFMRDEFRVTPRWWQALAATRQLEHDADGALVWREVVESGPRRIGKSVRLRGAACWRCSVGAERFHETQLAMLVSKDLAVGKEIHRGSWRWADAKGWNVLRLNGAQELETPKGDRWLLRAPNAAYGYDVGYGQVDESWGVDPMAITDGLEPALLERHSPQLHLTSTAHVKASSLMRRRLTAALRDADPDVLLLLWGAHPDANFAAEETWRASSPHWTSDRRDLIARKYAAALAGQDEPEFDDPDPVRGWAAQYLNVWPLLIGGGADSLFPSWARLEQAAPDAPVGAIGVSANIEQTFLSLGSTLMADVPHVGATLREPVANRAGFVGEVKRIQSERACPVVMDRKSPASFLIPDLEAAGVSVTFTSLDEYVQAVSDFEKAVKDGAITHGDYPELNAAVDAATWRKVPTDRRVFGRKHGDIDMLEAVTLALWGATANHYDLNASVLL